MADNVKFDTPITLEFCPICGRVASLKVYGCSLFFRLRMLKFSEDENESDLIKSKLLRDFHADPCRTCGKGNDECHEGKVRKVMRDVKAGKIQGKFPGWISPEEVNLFVSEQECQPVPVPGRVHRVRPAWYVKER